MAIVWLSYYFMILFSSSPMLFLPLLLSFGSFCSSIKSESPSPILVTFEEWYGLIRLAPFCLFLGLWILLFMLISTRLARWAFFLSFFFLGPFPFFFPEGDHPSVAGPFIWPMGQRVPLPILHGYPFSLGFYSPLFLPLLSNLFFLSFLLVIGFFLSLGFSCKKWASTKIIRDFYVN